MNIYESQQEHTLIHINLFTQLSCMTTGGTSVQIPDHIFRGAFIVEFTYIFLWNFSEKTNEKRKTLKTTRKNENTMIAVRTEPAVVPIHKLLFREKYIYICKMTENNFEYQRNEI